MFDLNGKHTIAHSNLENSTTNEQSNFAKLLIFTDLDGSLLDHYSYSHSAADMTLTQLKQLGVPVIPSSSKTKDETLYIRQALDNAHPFIIENGAVVYIPIGYFKEQPEGTKEIGPFWVKKFVHSRQYWRSLLSHIVNISVDKYTVLSELTTEEIAKITGLDNKSAALVSRRFYGEPIVWKGNEAEKKIFANELEKMGANILQGGRFLHISGADCNKGIAMRWLVNLYQQDHDDSPYTTIAIGDSQSDVAMLDTADIALMVRSPAHDLPELNRQQNTFVSEQHGPTGWAQGIQQILESKFSIKST